MTYQDIKNSAVKNNYKFFSSGDFNLNFWWIRNDEHASNHFTDDLVIAYKENGIEKTLEIKCTTKPGLKGSLYNPVTVEGITGTAVIMPGQYSGAWQFIDSYTEFSQYPFFRQIRGINYWRDGDKDNEIDEVNEQLNKLFGTQWHRMSNVGDKRQVADYEINTWSLGCIGSIISEWDKVIALTRKCVAIYGNVFTGTIINRKDL